MWSNTRVFIAAIVIFVYVCGLVAASTDGSEDVPNEEGGYYYYYPEASNVSNVLTTEDVQRMIEESRDVTRRLVLTDRELPNLIEKHVKILLAKRRECMAQDLHYYDFEIPDCKSCLRLDCDMDETCKTECRGMLQMKQQKQALDAERIGIEQLGIKYHHLAEKQSQNEGNDNAWIVGTTAIVIFTAIDTIVIIPLAVLVGIMWTKRNEPRPAVTCKPKYDEEAELNGLMKVGIEAKRDSGTGSEIILERDQNAAN